MLLSLLPRPYSQHSKLGLADGVPGEQRATQFCLQSCSPSFPTAQVRSIGVDGSEGAVPAVPRVTSLDLGQLSTYNLECLWDR